MIMAIGFVMSGCGEEDPMELFKKASDNMSKADALSFEGNVAMSIKAGGQEMKLTADMDGDYIKSTTDDPTDLQMKLHMKMDMMGQSNEMTAYIKDGYTYSDDGTNKTKTQFENKSAEQINKIMETKLDMTKYVKESSMEDDVIKMSVDGKKMMADIMDKYKDALGGDSGNATIDSYADMLDKAGIDNIDIETTIKDENFTTFKMTMPMKIDMGTGEKSDAELVIDFSKISVNPDLKEIEVPNADQYK
jgi:hypothetical protein